eukprot:gene919-975_t
MTAKVELLTHKFQSLSVTPSCSTSTSSSSLTSQASRRKEDPFMEMMSVLSGNNLVSRKPRKRAMSCEDETEEEKFDYEINDRVYKRCRKLLIEDLFALPDCFDPKESISTNVDDALALSTSCLADFLSTSNDECFFASIFQMEEERIAQ